MLGWGEGDGRDHSPMSSFGRGWVLGTQLAAVIHLLRAVFISQILFFLVPFLPQ